MSDLFDADDELDRPPRTGTQPAVRARGGAAVDSEALLRRAADLLASAKTMPFSSSVALSNRDELLDLLEEAISRLPEELRTARWMLKEREEFLAKTRREADDILDAARVQAERLVARTEVVRASETRARRILEAAEEESRRMHAEVEDFIDQKLASFEIVLDKVRKVVQAGRERLAVNPMAQPDGTPDPAGPGAAFFDQDHR